MFTLISDISGFIFLAIVIGVGYLVYKHLPEIKTLYTKLQDIFVKIQAVESRLVELGDKIDGVNDGKFSLEDAGNHIKTLLDDAKLSADDRLKAFAEDISKSVKDAIAEELKPGVVK